MKGNTSNALIDTRTAIVTIDWWRCTELR